MMSERERWENGVLPREIDNPIIEKVLGLWDITTIVAEGLTEAAQDGVKWLGGKVTSATLNALEALDDAQDVWGDDE